ncbi:MAG: helicase-associated domain-containing protein [Anaerolineae bacterium]|nr:helicase-associated domain-containing protein [Thermoflexales bacterium]MDW8408310.1 helicase-associated domain-containing protein [Anaerolineae bacterium]
MRLLKSCLLDEPLPKLSAIADAWDVALEAASTREMAEALADHMLMHEAMQQAVCTLAPEAKAALGALIQTNGRMPVAAFERRFGALRPMGPGRLERERPWLAPANVTETLWYRGFIFRGFDRSLSNPVDVFYLPADLLAVLMQVADWQPQNKTGFVQPPPTERSSTALSALGAGEFTLEDITTLLSHIQNSETRLQVDGRWRVRNAAAVRPLLLGVEADDRQEERRVAFLERLIERMGWLRARQPALRLAPQPVLDWLQQPAAAQLRALFDAWREDDGWNDLRQVEGLMFDMEHAWDNHPLAERAAVLALLSGWAKRTAGRSFRVAEFVADVHANTPDFARPDGRYDTWHIRDALSGQFLHGFEHWDRIEGALIAFVLRSPLRWLGVLQIEDEQVHITEFGRHILLGEPLPFMLPVELRGIRVEVDGEVSIGVAARLQRFQLARIADPLGFRNGRHLFRLTPNSLARGRRQGIATPRMIEFLQQNSDTPPPASLLRAIRQWEEYGAQARLEDAVLLRVKDAATLDTLLLLPRVKRATVERLNPTCAIIRAHEAEAVAEEIARSGLLIEREAQSDVPLTHAGSN